MRTCQQRKYHCRILRSLRFMNRNSIGQFQFLQLLKRINGEASIFKFHLCSLSKLINFFKDSGISVKYTDSLLEHNPISSANFPFHLIIVPDLHDLISCTEQPVSNRFLRFSAFRRIQVSLKDLVKAFHAQKPFSHRGQHLYLKRFRIHITGQFLLNQCDHHSDNDVRIISLQKKEITTLVINLYLLTSVDFMCIHNNIALRSLTENLCQLYYRETATVNNISQDISRSHTGQLILIAYQNQSGPGCNSQKKRMHQMDVYHRHLINNDHVCLQRILRISLKFCRMSVSLLLRHSVQFKKPMDSLCFISCCFCHSLCCTSGRCSQAKFCALTFKKTYNSINGSCLTCTRSTCQDKQTMTGSLSHCFLLHFIQNRSCFFLNHGNSALDKLFILGAQNIQFIKHTGSIQFQIIILCRINNGLAILLLQNQLPVNDHIHKVLLHIGFIHPQKSGTSCK